MTVPSDDGQIEVDVNEPERVQREPRPARELLPLVYDELRRLAAQRLGARAAWADSSRRPRLVHEAYLCDWSVASRIGPGMKRGHFFAAAAEAMRRILVENARRRHRVKRGGNRARVDLDKAEPTTPETDDDLLALDDALDRLANQDPIKAQLVQLRVFAGLTVVQAAEILGLSKSTADRYWAYARAWLRVEIAGRDAPSVD